VERYQAWTPQFSVENARQAVLAFDGDVYDGLQARGLPAQDLEWAHRHVCILSGLYGVLRPMDLMQPYRLEMGTSLAVGRSKNLVQFWGPRIAPYLNERLVADTTPVVVNLASQEYFRSVDTRALKARVVECVFEEQRPGSRLRMGNFNPLRLTEGQLKEIYDWAHDELGFRPELQAQFAPGAGTTYTLNVTNNGEAGKGLSAQGMIIDVVVPAGVTVTATTGDGYKGVHMDDKAKSNVAEWQVARLAPKDAKAFSVTLSQAPANPADLKGTIRWAKPAPKTGAKLDVTNFVLRTPG
jgi:hypothetical protein